MPDGRVTVAVGQHEVAESTGALLVGKRWLRFGSSGVDEIEIELAANAGSPSRPLAKGASGGELSRVMLAIEVALAGTSPVPTFVFDEVDAGVGGRAAVEVGRRLAELAKTAQVLLTDLPQVAAMVYRHVVVEKSSDGTITTSGLTVLDPEAREREKCPETTNEKEETKKKKKNEIAAVTTILFAASCWNFGYPDCSVEPAGLSEDDFHSCYYASVIGRCDPFRSVSALEIDGRDCPDRESDLRGKTGRHDHADT